VLEKTVYATKILCVSAVSRRDSHAAKEFVGAHRRGDHQPIIQPKCLDQYKSNIASQKTGDAGDDDSRAVDAGQQRAEVGCVVGHLFLFYRVVAVVGLRSDSLKRGALSAVVI
jgi:hypothetical protein